MSHLPFPPFIDVPGIHNFRDIGGYPLSSTSSSSTTTKPGSLRRHYIYRCADPSRVTPAGRQKLRDLGVATVFDLRSVPEINRAKAERGTEVLQLEGAERRFTPAFREEDYSPEKIAVRYREYARGGPEGFTKAYADILANAGASYGVILRHVRDRPHAPAVMHCTAGKDRTGVIVALTMSIAGASDEVIAKEYALTEQGLAPMRAEIMQHLLAEDKLADDRAGVERMVTAREENMLAVLEMIRETYGGAEGYAKSCCGLDDGDLEKIRENLTADVAAVL